MMKKAYIYNKVKKAGVLTMSSLLFVSCNDFLDKEPDDRVELVTENQVVMLLMGYLDYMPPELKEEQVVTAAAINNYVRKGIMPSPEKKKYYRVHIAYLVMICTLKQSLSIAMLQKLLPAGRGEEEVRPVYEAYVRRHRESARFFVRQVRAASANILKHPDAGEDAVENTEDLIASTAIVGGFARLLAEKLLLLDGCDLETGGSIEVE